MIRDWPTHDRPRERLLSLGSAVLSDAELLAILIGNGSRHGSALQLAQALLSQYQQPHNLRKASLSDFQCHHGLGPAKYCRIQAALELARRQQRPQLQQTLSNSDQVEAVVVAELGSLDHEVMACLFLDGQNRLIALEQLFHGTINTAAVYPRTIIQRALYHNAMHLILAHNHPSGSNEPSSEDQQITQHIATLCRSLDITLLDHLIVANQRATSMAALGMVPH